MEVRVLRAYRTQYTDPISMQTGDELALGRHDDEFPGWIWATAASGKTGWVPESYLEITGDRGRALRDYTARELDVNEGEVLTVAYQLAGWGWATNAAGRSGWVPLEHVEARAVGDGRAAPPA